MDNTQKEDKILLARAEELAGACSDRYMITNTEFLDLRQRSLVQSRLSRMAGIKYGFYGGYDDAERVIVVFMPDYVMEENPAEHFAAEPDDNPLTVLRMTKKKGAPALSHRDYLGSLMGLGIRRDVTGDILVRDDGADVIVLRSIAEFIETNMSQAGRSSLSIEEVPVTELIVPESDAKERHVSVASMRLDNIVGAAFGLSRTKSAEAIRGGIVFVSGIEETKPDHIVKEGDKIVLRHKGRAIVGSVDGRTGKGRLHLTLKTYR